ARLGSSLLARLAALTPPADLVPQKRALLAALAALEESRVELDTATRARVLTDQQDPGAHLAQAVTLLQIRRHFAHAVAVDSPCDESAHLAARLSDELAIGTCSDGYELLLGPDGAGSHSTEGLRALAGAGCAPACARTALSGTGDDAVLEASRACRTESDVVYAPFEDASRSLGEWSRAATTRLEAITDDSAVRAVLEATPAVPQGGHLPMPPSLFVTNGNRAMDVPPVGSAEGSGVEIGATAALVWVPASGDVIVRSNLQFTLDVEPAVIPSAVPIDGIGSALAQAIRAGDTGHPAAIVLDREALAPRFVSVLQHVPHAAPAGAAPSPLAGVLGFAVRHGAFTRIIPVRVLDAMPAGSYLRVGERQITVVDHDAVAQVVTLAPPPSTGADLLGGAIPDAAPAAPAIVVFEPDASGQTITRVLDALAVHAARASHPDAPQVVAAVAEGALSVNVTDAARATALRAAVDSHRAEAMHCLEAAPADAPAVARVDLHLVLGARGRITRAEYLARVRQACAFLEGESTGMREAVEEEMTRAAGRLDFEKAARLRNLLEDIRETAAPRRKFVREIPGTVIPERDLEILRDELRLPALPAVIECFDISNISVTHKVASMVAFRNGRPDRSS
ncbi:MAG: UvrB/UvrC motif-containing protein, partial [Deltaproteobacteria bacterium]